MKWNEAYEARMLRLSLKAFRVDASGQTFLLAPWEDGVIQLVHGASGMVIADYELEAGETVEELAECLGALLPESKVLAPTCS